MITSMQSIAKVLKDHGYSATRPRKLVFMTLLDKEPQSMGEIASALNGVIDRVSIYRTVTLFESLGIVDRLSTGWKHKFELSDSFTKHHHHVTCIRCNKIVSFEESDAIKQVLKEQAKQVGYLETGHQLEIRGICDSCQ